jgi:hypothetical protein
MVHVQAGIVLGQIGIAGIAKNGLHEIEVAHQVSGGKEANPPSFWVQ